MRVALLDPPSFTPPYDHALASALAAAGQDVHLLTSPFLRGPAPVPDGYRRHEVFFPLSGRLLRRPAPSPIRVLVKAVEYAPSAVRLIRRIDELRPDVVHVQWLAMPRYDAPWLRRVIARHRTVLTAHEILPRLRQNRAAWCELLRAVDRVVVHSEEALDQLAELAGRERLVHIPHPVFDASAEYEPSPPGGRTLLFFGFLRHYKGLDVLVRALPLVARDVPDVRLVVAGAPLEPVIGPLHELAAAVGVEGRIEWHVEFVAPERIRALMEAAAAVVLPYRSIDSSGVLATALGHGRPAVVSDVGSLGATVREFGAGLVVPPEDVEALAQACTRILADEDLRASAFRGAVAARDSLTWDAAARKHVRLYEAVAGGGGRTRTPVAERI